jgi:hypothetical protein
MDMKGKIPVWAIAALVVTAGVSSGQRWGYTGAFTNQMHSYSYSSISGDYYLLGNGMYHWDGTTWNFHQWLEWEGLGNPQGIGEVCLQDTYCLVGAPEDDGMRGRVHFFRLVGDQWRLEQTIQEDDTIRFGWFVSMDRGKAVIGETGKTFFYELQDGQWILSQSVSYPDDQYMGKGVIWGDHCAVMGSIPGQYSNSPRPGIVCLNRFKDGQWMATETLRFEQGIRAVVLKGNHLAVQPGPWDSQDGIWLYAFDGTAWMKDQTIPRLPGTYLVFDGLEFSSTPDELLLAAMSMPNGGGSAEVNLYEFQNRRWELVDKISEWHPARLEDGLFSDTFVFNHYHLLVPDFASVYGYRRCPGRDLTGDCRVDLLDFAALAGEWMTGI